VEDYAMSLDSEEVKLLNTYFPRVLFWEGQDDVPSDRNAFAQLERYWRPNDNGLDLDLVEMAKSEVFKCLFPPPPKVDTAYVARVKATPDGSVPRPYIEDEDKLFAKQGVSPMLPHFFTALETQGNYAKYSYESKSFIFDFSQFIHRKPQSIYEAFLRYAHAQYTRMAINASGQPVKKGSDILYEYLSKHKFFKFDDGKYTFWDFVEDALQEFPEGNPYQLGTLDYIKNYITQEIGKYPKAPSNKGMPSVFSKEDCANINRSAKDEKIRSEWTQEKTKENQDRLAILDSGSIINKLKLLYIALCNPSIAVKVDARQRNTIKALYWKLIMHDPDSLDTPMPGVDNFTEYEVTPSKSYEPSRLNQQDQKMLLQAFESQFAGEQSFLDEIKKIVQNDTPAHIASMLTVYTIRYICEKCGCEILTRGGRNIPDVCPNCGALAQELTRQGGRRNTESALRRLYCEANDFNIDDPFVKRAHTAFTTKIRKVISQFISESSQAKEEA
jgi:hypothetical protein